jgi:protein farnesyltransferase/geranylgeranyltransferase type-1 subunit alpha
MKRIIIHGVIDNGKNPFKTRFVKEFKSYDGEFEFIERMLEKDPRNNSVWNHRFFVINLTQELTKEVRIKEINYAFEFLKKSPNNESGWNYMTGMANFKNKEEEVFDCLQEICEEFAKKAVINSYVHSALVDIYERKKNDEYNKKAWELCQKLKKLDKTRVKYWEFREKSFS